MGRRSPVEAREHAHRMIEKMQFDFPPLRLFFAMLLRGIGLQKEALSQYEAAARQVKTPYEKLLIQLVECSQREDYSRVAEVISDFLVDAEANPEIYSILGRVQSYIDHKDARATLERAADAHQHDAMILLSSILQREGDTRRASQLLDQVVSAEGIDPLTRSRALLGLNRISEAVSVLESYLEEKPGDFLAWFLLVLAKRGEGEASIKQVLRKMFEAGYREPEEDASKKFKQIFEVSSAVDQLTKEVQAGEVGGKVKHSLLNKQIMDLLQKEFRRE